MAAGGVLRLSYLSCASHASNSIGLQEVHDHTLCSASMSLAKHGDHANFGAAKPVATGWGLSFKAPRARARSAACGRRRPPEHL